METLKKHKVAIIIGILALIAIWYFFLRKKTTPVVIAPAPKPESGYAYARVASHECCCDPHCNKKSASCCNGGSALAAKGANIGGGAVGVTPGRVAANASGCAEGTVICGTTEGNYPKIKCCDKAGNLRGLGNSI